MAKTKQEQYGNSSISMLKGEDRVRKRPAVIFGSDDLEGCKHAVFEILSNAIDEAREGHGDTILVTRYEDLSVEVEDFGRGCPVDYNEKEKRYNWELVFCEMYAGGKYGENGENYEYSLGLNGLGSCATQYASEFFDATIHRDGYRYDLHFEKGRNKGGLKKEPTDRKKTGSRFHWKPDRQVFTDINIPVEYYRDVLRRQAVVNKGITFKFRNQVGKQFEEEQFCYADGIRQGHCSGYQYDDLARTGDNRHAPESAGHELPEKDHLIRWEVRRKSRRGQRNLGSGGTGKWRERCRNECVLWLRLRS